MIHLLQILNMLNKKQFELFEKLFSDLDYELNEMGWSGHESELINDLLSSHFEIELSDQRQLESITQVIINKSKFESTMRYHRITKNWNE